MSPVADEYVGTDDDWQSMWAELTAPTPERVAEVALAHGTGAAARWAGISLKNAQKHRRLLDPTKRTAGRPSLADMERAKPRLDCPCTMCVVWRSDEVHRLNQAYATVGRPTLVDGDLSWVDEAACTGKPPEWWFPTYPDGTAVGHGEPHRYDEGRAICVDCPVRERCLEWAKVNKIEHGMWGGETPWERTGLTYGGRPVQTCPSCGLLFAPERKRGAPPKRCMSCRLGAPAAS